MSVQNIIKKATFPIISFQASARIAGMNLAADVFVKTLVRDDWHRVVLGDLITPFTRIPDRGGIRL